MGEADGSSVVSDNVGDLVLAECLALNLAEFEACFFGINADWHEAALHIVEDSEVLISFHDVDTVHESERETWVSAGFVVDLNINILVAADFETLLAGESVLQSLSQQNGNWDAFTEFVRSSGWARCVWSNQFVELPVRWRVHSLQVLLGSSCLIHTKHVSHSHSFLARCWSNK